MFWAISKTTGERINTITATFSEEFMKTEEWYADPLEIEHCPDNIDINKIEVRHRKRSKEIINYKGTIYFITSHFYIPNAEKLGIIINPDNTEHNKARDFIYHLLEKNMIQFKVSTDIKNSKENNMLFSNTEFDLNKIQIEASIKDKNIKRADVLLPFKEYNTLFGFGIVFEIQLTNQTDKLELERSFERANKGYSVCWIKPEYLDINMILIKPILEIDLFHNILKKYEIKSIENIKELTINYSKMLNGKLSEMWSIAERINLPDAIKCPECEYGWMFKRKSKYTDSYWYGCSNYPVCKKTFNVGTKNEAN